MKPFGRIGVVGAGTMGRGIAAAVVTSGLPVTLVDTSASALDSARDHFQRDYGKQIARGRLDGAGRAVRELLLTVSEQLNDLSGCDLVIETVPEVVEVKTSVLGGIAKVVADDAVIATNTSSIPISTLAGAVERPERFLGLHFFNPVPRMPLVEVVHTVLTSSAVAGSVGAFVGRQLGKTPLNVVDRPGFVVNWLLVPMMLSAARMLDSGYATATEIDSGMKGGCGHPMGPLELADMIGLDIVVQAADAMYRETRDPALVVPNSLRRLVDVGRLGKKSGTGFYDYRWAIE